MAEQNLGEQLEKMLNLNNLLDFYGELLTPKQRMMLTLFYQDDLSLGEIALEEGISRQAVHDIIRRSQALLKEYEAKLKLVEAYQNRQAKMEELQNIANVLQNKPGEAMWAGFWEKWQSLKDD